MDIVAAYQLVGSYRGAAEICGTTHKTVKRVIERTAVTAAGEQRPVRAPRPSNYEVVRALVTDSVSAGKGRVSAKRLLPKARAVGYAGSDRNFRRLVAQERRRYRRVNGHPRRPAVWAPGEHLVIDWGRHRRRRRLLCGARMVAGAVRAVRRRRAGHHHAGDAR